MKKSDLEIFNQMPFLFWVTDQNGRYLWGNGAINHLSGEEVAGKTDSELVWAENAAVLQEADRQVFRTGEPDFLHETVDRSDRGAATLSVCQFIGVFEGERCCFGVSFVVE